MLSTSRMSQLSKNFRPPLHYTFYVIAIPVAILIQLLTLVYSIVLSEDGRGCKLYL